MAIQYNKKNKKKLRNKQTIFTNFRCWHHWSLIDNTKLLLRFMAKNYCYLLRPICLQTWVVNVGFSYKMSHNFKSIFWIQRCFSFSKIYNENIVIFSLSSVEKNDFSFFVFVSFLIGFKYSYSQKYFAFLK